MSIDNIRRIKEMANEPKKAKYYSIPKVSAKRKLKIEENKLVLAKDAEFYKEIWSERPHICFNCDSKLPRTLSNWMMHHFLEKAKYPEFRHLKSNVGILCLQCHSQIHTLADKCPKIVKKTEELKETLLK